MSLASQFRDWLALTFPKKALGDRGEDAAVRFLTRLGYRIIECGYDSPLGELDIIAVDGRTVVFIEVKTRTSQDAGHPADAVDATKQRRMSQSALAYLKSKRLLEYPARFDVVAVTWPAGARRPTIEHFANAFASAGSGPFYS
jgi:putative endonuclease